MEVSVPFRVEYKTEKPVPIPEIIASLQSLQRVLEDSAYSIEKLIPGLEVKSVAVNGGVKFGHCGGAKVGQFGASALERAALI